MKRKYFRFDHYIISKMLDLEWETGKVRNFSQEDRYKAYRICLERIGKKNVAATQTLKKWFGFREWSKPNRENLFELGFALEFSDLEAREMFVKGAHEPDFQVNDYREMIFLYGFKHRMNYRECQDMIEEFELALPDTITLQQHNRTSDMWENYEKNCHLERGDFLAWMLERAEFFKGYSLTVLEYFQELKEEILTEIKEDAAMRLEELLAECGFFRWEKKRHLSTQKRKKTILLWLKKTDTISDNLAKTIDELLAMAEMPVESNSEFLSEIYADAGKCYWQPNMRRRRGEIYLMDDKYLSDLLNVSTQKEKLMELILQKKDDKRNTEELAAAIREQKRRCRLLGRSDLLPLILCVSQKRYLRRLETEDYDAGKAKKEFTNLANHIMVSCQMVPLNEKRYELDALLCSCYNKEEMYSYADVLERYFKER